MLDIIYHICYNIYEVKNLKEMNRMKTTITVEEKKMELMRTPKGSIVLLTNGDKYELVNVNRKNFVGINIENNKRYNVPIQMFVEIVEVKNETK
ncbi:hypothetical protein EOM09_06450, partial [bacterium]|nr:hypothetical protein [bacterium]